MECLVPDLFLAPVYSSQRISPADLGKGFTEGTSSAHFVGVDLKLAVPLKSNSYLSGARSTHFQVQLPLHVKICLLFGLRITIFFLLYTVQLISIKLLFVIERAEISGDFFKSQNILQQQTHHNIRIFVTSLALFVCFVYSRIYHQYLLLFFLFFISGIVH